MSGKFRKRVANLPVIGPVIRRGYRGLKHLYIDTLNDPLSLRPQRTSKSSRKSINAVTVVRVAQPTGLLRRTPIYDGYATFSTPDIAAQTDAFLQALGAQIPVILFPSDRGNLVHIGVMDHDIRTVTSTLAASLSTTISWQDTDDDSTAFFSKIISGLRRHRRLSVALKWPGGIAVRVVLTAYHEKELKDDTRNDRNVFLRHIHGEGRDTMRTPGLHLVETLFSGPPAGMGRTPVDVVYTWVNHEDPDWQVLYAAAKGTPAPDATLAHEGEGEEADASSLARFTSRNELLYSIRSVEQYIPWVRRIYVLTNCAPPAWLEPDDHVIWVRHDEIMAPRHLPTFSSHGIESYLHKIPDLAENFIYLNDDMFVNEYLPRSFFFADNDMPNANLEDYGVVNGHPDEASPDYLNAARNGATLLQETFGVYPTRLHKHTPYALKRSMLDTLEATFPDAFEATRSAPFRSITDISVTSFLFHHFCYLSGRGTQVGYRAKILKNTATNIKGEFNRMVEGSGCRAFCINDGIDSHLDDAWNAEVPRYLARRFPIPARHEVSIDPDLPATCDDLTTQT
ncbi:stealth conserved region 3 domain-containing protein [Celeribacter sp.]|uniref:stealth conserved region 3 domain-containing protein n=1 Tax=Celeribacter sp. TaxID=1890673 RepID=UPI003A8E3145